MTGLMVKISGTWLLVILAGMPLFASMGLAALAFLWVRPVRRSPAVLLAGLVVVGLALASVWTQVERGRFHIASGIYTMGAPLWWRDLGWTDKAAALPSLLLIVVPALALAWSGVTVGLTVRGQPRERLLAALGAIVLLSCFLAGVNYAYRWIFALWPAVWLWRQAADSAPGRTRWAARLACALVLLGLWLDGARAQAPRFLLFAGAALACTLVSPLGLEQSVGIFSVGKSALARTAVLEWMPTFDAGFRQARFFWLAMLTTLGTAALLIWQGRRCSAVDVLMFLAFTVLAAWSIRFLVYVGLVAAFVLAPLARRPPLDPQRATRTWAWTGLVHALVLVVAARYGNANGSFPYRADAPEKLTLPMVQALGDPALSGNVITSYAFGAELVYRAYPRLKPSIDSRIDSYGDDYLRFHEAMLASEGLMEEFVGRYDVRYMLVKPAQFQAMQRWPSWTAGRWSVLLADSRAVRISGTLARSSDTSPDGLTMRIPPARIVTSIPPSGRMARPQGRSIFARTSTVKG